MWCAFGGCCCTDVISDAVIVCLDLICYTSRWFDFSTTALMSRDALCRAKTIGSPEKDGNLCLEDTILYGKVRRDWDLNMTVQTIRSKLEVVFVLWRIDGAAGEFTKRPGAVL